MGPTRTAPTSETIDLRGSGPIAAEIEHRMLIDLQIAPDRVRGLSFGPFGINDRRLIDLTDAGRKRRFGRSKPERRTNRVHLGGPPESLARSLPLDIVNPALVVSEHALSIWDFGPDGHAVPGRRAFTVPLQQVQSIEPAGVAEAGYLPARVTFIDESWIDFMVADLDGAPDFWKATTHLRPSR